MLCCRRSSGAFLPRLGLLSGVAHFRVFRALFRLFPLLFATLGAGDGAPDLPGQIGRIFRIQGAGQVGHLPIVPRREKHGTRQHPHHCADVAQDADTAQKEGSE